MARAKDGVQKGPPPRSDQPQTKPTHPFTLYTTQDTFPNRWDISAAGHIESGQDSRDTAVRELAEELGVETSADELDFAFTVGAVQVESS
jgi:8-oxo-dGTP pyrophosphatase MutT (NUDIX family)